MSDPTVLSIWATVLGLVSAIGYTAANIGLRAVAECDPIWVSCMKAVPTLVGSAPIVWWQWRHRQVEWPDRRVLFWLTVSALVGQLGGNVLFQWSLGVIGIALSVPLTLGTLIVAGALLGKFALSEPLSRRTIGAVLLLSVAVFVLSAGAERAHQSVVGSTLTVGSWWRVAWGVSAAVASGVAYAVLGAVIRHGVKRRTTVAMTLLVVSLVGVLGLGLASLMQHGPNIAWQYSATQYGRMLAAGIFNAVAFVALTRAFQMAHMVYINALNGSQAAMAAVAGILIFHEAPTPMLWLGLTLTIAGLVLLDRRA